MNLHVVFDRHMPMQATKSKQSLMIETLVFDISCFQALSICLKLKDVL